MLIKCSECGKEISDKAASCPNCGCPASEFSCNKQIDTRSEVDRAADEIFWNAPGWTYTARSAKLLSKQTGISIDDARKMISFRHNEWKKGKKTGKYPNTQYCPYCASQDVEAYEEPGITVTSRANVFGGTYISSSAPNSKWMRCNRCGCSWKPKKR